MKIRHEINYRGLTLEVVGFYSKSSVGTWDNPGDPQEFEIHEVYLNGTNINVLFDGYSELERMTLEEHYI